MDIEVYQTVAEKDGTISAYVRFKDEITGKTLKQACVQGKTQAEFETALADYTVKLESENTSKSADVAMVKAAISKLKSATAKEL